MKLIDKVLARLQVFALVFIVLFFATAFLIVSVLPAIKSLSTLLDAVTIILVTVASEVLIALGGVELLYRSTKHKEKKYLYFGLLTILLILIQVFIYWFFPNVLVQKIEELTTVLFGGVGNTAITSIIYLTPLVAFILGAYHKSSTDEQWRWYTHPGILLNAIFAAVAVFLLIFSLIKIILPLF